MLANDPKDNVDGPVFVVSRATTRQLMPDRGDNLVEVVRCAPTLCFGDSRMGLSTQVMTLEPSH